MNIINIKIKIKRNKLNLFLDLNRYASRNLLCPKVFEQPL